MFEGFSIEGFGDLVSRLSVWLQGRRIPTSALLSLLQNGSGFRIIHDTC